MIKTLDILPVVFIWKALSFFVSSIKPSQNDPKGMTVTQKAFHWYYHSRIVEQNVERWE